MLVQTNDAVYPNMDKLEACGLIPHWVADYTLGNNTETDLKEHLAKCYTFGLYEMGGEVAEDGTFQYPGDDDLPWIVKMDTPDGILYQYLYGIVAIPTKDGYFVTRMD